MLLALYILQVAGVSGRVAVEIERRAMRLDRMVIPEMGGKPRERVDRINVDPLYQRSFGRVDLRHEQGLIPLLLGQVCHRQQPVNVTERTVQRQLAEEQHPVEVCRDLFREHQQRDRDGQIVGGAFLAQVSRRKVHGDAPARVAQPGIDDGRTHALRRFLDGGIGQADERDVGERAGIEVGLHLDDGAVQTDQSTTMDFGKHGSSSWQ